MASIKTEGSQVTSGTTEHTLATVTDAGTYVLAVDLSDMVKADVLKLRIKTKLTSGDTSRLAYIATYSGLQSIMNTYSIPVVAPIEFVATLQMTVGGGTFIWAVYAL
jgi:hypothetical protein